MTVDTDLATLHHFATGNQDMADTVRRVEAALRDKDAEIERLYADLAEGATWYECGDDVAHHVWKERAEAAERELARLRETLDAIENELGTLPLDHLGPATERSVSKAWAMAREKRPDPELVPSPLARALLADTAKDAVEHAEDCQVHQCQPPWRCTCGALADTPKDEQ